jgi:Aspartyl protease/PDZ domain
MRTHRPATLLLLALVGCSSASPSSPTPPSSFSPPSRAELVAFTRLLDSIVVPVDVGGTTALLQVDTGNPWVEVNPKVFPEAPSNAGNVATLSVESERLTNVQVVSKISPCPNPDPEIVVGGFLGCTVICKSVVSLNYRDVAFTLGPQEAPPDLLPETKIPFALEGGGTDSLGGFTVTTPPSRIVVSVDVEGVTHRMIVDTGASFVTVDQALFASITKDGRPQLDGGMACTTSGPSTSTAARVLTISVAEAAVHDVVISHDTAFDETLALISEDAGETIEGSLGGTFLDNFYVTIDYAAGELHLAPYGDTSFVVDPARSMGFGLKARPGGGYMVSSVVPGTDAASKGVHAGDEVLAIDGEELAPLSDTEATVLLFGKVGATKMVQFGAAAKLDNMTVAITVNEFLPT